ncbi:uncharacterized protein LOC118343995 [Juglans regia]|uniref:Uncharacterized protein LOC118343995 n=1 Tax=Juglans regia TaxID=51240 RepID=A0A6P9DWU0_JUGRE|nr:uncharacterized protein LOC118343995 [Juglans regia]
MTRALNAKNKLVFVNGTLPPPEPTSTDYKQWNQTKDMVLTWLLNSISPSLANSLEFHTDPREVWLDLQSRFCHGNNARIYHLKRELSSLQQHTQSIHNYYNQIRQIWDELSHLQKTNDLKELQQQSEDEREEQQHLLHVRPTMTSEATHVFAAHSGGPPKKPLLCTECGKHGHTRDRCWRIIASREPRGKQPSFILGKPPSSSPMVHQVSASSPIPDLTPDLYQRLLDLLKPPTPTANFVGPVLDEVDWSG